MFFGVVRRTAVLRHVKDSVFERLQDLSKAYGRTFGASFHIIVNPQKNLT